MGFKIHLEENEGYACTQSFNQMPISKKLLPREFGVELRKNPESLCKRCVTIYIRKANNLKRILENGKI